MKNRSLTNEASNLPWPGEETYGSSGSSIKLQTVEVAPALTNRRAGVCVFIIVLALGLFYGATVREGHDWGDDFSLYISHARNISKGITYQQTDYIFNPAIPKIGPRTYPPIFPVLLSPVYWLFGMNLTALKMVAILMFLLSLPIIFLMFRNELPNSYLLVLLVIFGANPYFWRFKDNIVSDLPFLMLVCLGLFLCQRAYRSEESKGPRLSDILLTSLTIYLAYGTRSIGLLLIPCLWLYDLIRFRRPGAFVIKVTCLLGTVILIQNLFFHNDSSYLSIFGFGSSSSAEGWRFILRTPLENPLPALRVFSDIWENGYIKALRPGLMLLVSGLAIIGYVTRLRKQLTHYEIFLALYTTAILMLPMEMETRLFFPIIPLYLFYALLGLQTISRPARKEATALVMLSVIFLATYVARYTTLDFGHIQGGVTSIEANQLFDYLRTNTDKNDVLIFRKPRALALFTERKVSAAQISDDDQKLWGYFQSINATHLVLGPENIDPSYYEFLTRFIHRHVDQTQEVFVNKEFKVYRINANAFTRLSVTK